jgi:2-polyprenyl-3-methyl-5-hydroxy-6-metoxy-1,4-benzoquinol methylase
MTDYETLYAQQSDVCGDPFPEFVRFFDGLPPGKRILDLGCGQGRDALVAARRGHRVVAVDRSVSGVGQVVQQAQAEGLTITGAVADIADYVPEHRFDVVVIDRVLHMLADDNTRCGVLAQMVRHIEPGGHLLVADTPKHLPMIRAFMAAQRPPWRSTLARKGFLFWQRVCV